MANDIIVELYEVWDKSIGASERTEIDASAGTSFTTAQLNRMFYIRVDTDTQTAVTIMEAVSLSGSDVPARGDPHPQNPYLFALDFELRRLGFVNWMLTVHYASLGQQGGDPLLEPPQESWTTQKWTASVDHDVNNKPITNAADEFYDDPIQREFSDMVLTRSVNLASFNTGFWYPFIDTLNANPSRGFPAKTGRIMSVTAQSRFRGTLAYWRVTIVVAYRNYYRKGQNGNLQQLGWTTLVVNKGYRLKKTSPSLRYEPLYDDGMPVRKPALLSADGSTRITDPLSATFREHPVYEPVDWTATGIG